MPRSGTTALLEFLYFTEQFSSFTYQNMPFVMAPNLFSTIKTSPNIQKVERFHRDGIFYDLSSPEAFDEVFFSTFSENEIKQELVNFISLFLLNKKNKRYLSKNNLNYKRIFLLQALLPNAFFLIPFREPLQHAYSLLNQHKHFLKSQSKDDFLRRYMNYLGHNEFGIDHKPWNAPKLFDNYDNLNYWLEQWLIFYNNAFNRYNNLKNCYFINYEKLTEIDYVKHITEILGLKSQPNFRFKLNQKEITSQFDKSLYLNAQEHFIKLSKQV